MRTWAPSIDDRSQLPLNTGIAKRAHARRRTSIIQFLTRFVLNAGHGVANKAAGARKKHTVDPCARLHPLNLVTLVFAT